MGVVGCGDRIAANGIWMNIVDTSRAKDKESVNYKFANIIYLLI